MVIHRHRNLAAFVHSNPTHEGSSVVRDLRLEQLLSARARDAFHTELPANESGEEDEAGYDGEASVAGTEASRGSLTSVD